ncbi:phospholipase A2 inhibitor and Ly6/PLAUR domain-containing protein-like [Labeo rohita]|uniref:phospholipase A2 inhibitor and Ly6/PLAUR domain-containing protein-like n=1 Tax=Labeo rohita TaxID=84645 RepID=UPI0021E2CC90|nr:phospholipase A2 inhibitor and Ly6/PLAUR domain-containing protein-like [Labeo rohita]
MDLRISFFLLFILFMGGHSLSCYGCPGVSGICMTSQCPTGSTGCFRTAFIANGVTVIGKGCASGGCPNGSINLGAGRVNPTCCNTDNCNAQDADLSNNAPNGMMCYYCNGQSCSNKLNCSGSEDRCGTVTATFYGPPLVLKGCVSKSICDAPVFISGVNSTSCCEGNLCNGVNSVIQSTTQSANSAQSVTQSFLFLCCSLLSFILLH